MAQTKQQQQAAQKKSTAVNEMDIILATDPQINRATSKFESAESDLVNETRGAFQARLDNLNPEIEDHSSRVLDLHDKSQDNAQVKYDKSHNVLRGTTLKLNRSGFRTLMLELKQANQIGDVRKRQSAIDAAYTRAGILAE